MVREQLIARGIMDERVIAAMREIPRHLFLDQEAGPQAYSDHAFPIGYSQTMSQPFTVAYLSECLELKGDERVLEIGTGSGYQAAVLSKLAGEVFTIERIGPLADKAAETIKALNIHNVRIKVGDGAQGWDSGVLFDRVLFTAAARSVSHELLMQLRDGGFLLGPVQREDGGQEIVKMIRKGSACTLKRLKECAFVPMMREGEMDARDIPINRERFRGG